MKKFICTLLFFLLITFFIPISLASNTNAEIIGTVNNENLYLIELNRLFNTYKKKLDKNIIVDKELEKKMKETLTDKMINKLLVLQEAKARNIQVPEEEITKRLNILIEKEGGEEEFKTFLTQNNATLQEVKNEIKNSLLYELVKNQLPSLQSFISKKREKANIIIYNDKVLNPSTQESRVILRVKQYPAITKSKVDELQKLHETTSQVLAKLEQESKEIKQRNNKEKNLLLEAQNLEKKPSSQVLESTEQKPIEISKIEGPTIIKPLTNKKVRTKVKREPKIIVSKEQQLSQPSKINDISKEIKELRRRIDQRRIGYK